MSDDKSRLTAIRRTTASAPIKWLVQEGIMKAGRDGKWLLDYGCGHGKDVEWLREAHDIDAYGWDPNHRKDGDALREKWEIITCTYVLNVVPPGVEDRILEDIHHLLEPGGVAYISVRRDIPRDMVGYTTGKGTYQRWVELPARYEKIREKQGYCIYKYTRGK